MTTLDPARFADLLVGYCLEVERDDEVLVRSTTGAEPLLLELQRAILQRGAWPLLRIELPGQARDFFLYAEGLQLDDVSDIMLREAKSAEKHLAIQAPHDTNALVGIDPERMTRLRRARQPIQAAAMGKTWCSTLWPTQALADQAGMELDAFTAFVAGAMFLTNPEPVTAWASLRRFQEKLITRLSEAQEAAARGAGHRPDAVGQEPQVGQLRRAAQHALGRGVHRPARDERRTAPSRSRSARLLPASRSTA